MRYELDDEIPDPADLLRLSRFIERTFAQSREQPINVCNATHYNVRVERFRDEATQNIRDGEDTKAARTALPIDRIIAAGGIQDLRVPPGNQLEKLSGDQYHICFVWTEDGARQIEICDYH